MSGSDYDAKRNAADSYSLAISSMREKLESFRKEVIGDCTLYLGDCREILPLLPRVDAVVTDCNSSADEVSFAHEKSAKRQYQTRAGSGGNLEQPASGDRSPVRDGAKVATGNCGSFRSDSARNAKGDDAPRHPVTDAGEQGRKERSLHSRQGDNTLPDDDREKFLHQMRDDTQTLYSSQERRALRQQAGKSGSDVHVVPFVDAQGRVVVAPQGWAIVTDPPYGISHSSNHGATWQRTQIANDETTEARDWVAARFRNTPAVFFGTWKTPPVEMARACVVWDKGPAFGMGDLAMPWKPSFELAYICGEGWEGNRDEGVLRGSVVVSWESAGRVHPHQKPVWLVEHFIKKLPHARTILDPFMGSGTTGVACVKLGRKFIGIEMEPKYFEIACKRIQAAYDQPDFFVEAAKPKAEQLDMLAGTVE